MLKKSDNKGFTIIEVVITIAIGAAVMALVLNAVAGARRSQRNNARASDVNQVAAAVGQYIATRNALPGCWQDIATIADNGDKLGHYAKPTAVTACGTADTGVSINPVSTSANPKGPANATLGDFPIPAAAPIGSADLTEDEFVIMRQAECTNTTTYAKGGIREMAIIYKLEGQSDAVCLEI